jgi:Tfp pilus assembly protein FimV
MAIYAPNTRIAQARRARVRRTAVFVVLIAAAAVFGPKAFAADSTGTPDQLDTYTVGSGDTLWQIAANLTPQGRDVRETMTEIEDVNALTTSQLQAGQQILLPHIEG